MDFLWQFIPGFSDKLMEKSRSSWNKTTTKTFLFAEYAVILFNKQKVVKQGVPHRRHQQSHANNVKVEHTKTYSCRNIRSRLINHDSCSCRLCSLYFWFEGKKIQGVPKRSFFSVRTPCINLKSCWHLPANNIWSVVGENTWHSSNDHM